MVSEGTAPTADAGLGLSVRTGHEVTLPPEQAGPGRLVPPPVPPPGPSEAPGPSEGQGTTGAAGTTDPSGAAGRAAEEPDPTRHRTADAAARLFRRWTEGDATASSELVSLLTPTLWHTARAYRLDRATAEDVVQNAWLALARRRDQVRDPQAVMAWLLVTVRRDAARTAASALTSVDDPGPVLAASPDPAPGPAAVVVEQESARRLWEAVGRLSERCQRLLRVVAFSDRPDYATLSVDLGMPLGSIGPTRGRCLKKLREDLGDEGRWVT
ncbi:RNA polymerase sigma factor [Aquipuribacter hungaricus]|uniref:RNA polymerase sigma factor n=1 Tax=Aquipuribacter hungaricus TaxID=545624 RepID=A0ABV7WGU6_9MICO